MKILEIRSENPSVPFVRSEAGDRESPRRDRAGRPPRRRAAVVAALVLLATAGCATSARWETRNLAAAETADGWQIVGDAQQLQFAKSVQVRLPAKLAVASPQARREEIADRRRHVGLVDRLRTDDETFTDVVSLFDWADESTNCWGDREAFRRAAGAHQADLMLLYRPVVTVEEQRNALAILNLLILPAFLVPTQSDRVAVGLEALLVDVRNGNVYSTFEDHGETEITATLFGEVAAVEDAIDGLFQHASGNLADRMAKRLRALEKDAASGSQ